jgi:hypothetical protein
MREQPQRSRGLHWIDTSLAPPCSFIAVGMNFTMVTAAERDGEFIADFAAECAALGEAQVVGVAGLAPTDQARLLRHEPDVLAVADAARFGEGEGGLVDSLARFRFSACTLLQFEFSIDGSALPIRISCLGCGAAAWRLGRERRQLPFEGLLDVKGVLFR